MISVQELSAEALARLAPAIATLARAEGLEAHARSVEMRVHQSGVGQSEVAQSESGVAKISQLQD